MPRILTLDEPIILFDGVCNLCNACVDFVIAHDRRGRFRFAALESRAGERLLGDVRHRVPLEGGSIVLVEGKRYYSRSTAALRIAKQLDRPWPLLYALIVIPRFFRDWIYVVVARNRYRLFGKRDSCRVPTPQLARRFLE